MSKLDNVEELIYGIIRSYPRWPSTFGDCANKCGRASGRGSGPCAYCIEDELTELVGKELAQELHESIKTTSKVWSAIADKVENK